MYILNIEIFIVSPMKLLMKLKNKDMGRRSGARGKVSFALSALA